MSGRLLGRFRAEARCVLGYTCAVRFVLVEELKMAGRLEGCGFAFLYLFNVSYQLIFFALNALRSAGLSVC